MDTRNKLLWIFLLPICSSQSSPKNGECVGLENVVDRNVLFNNSLQVDPCANVKVQKCLPKETPGDLENCTVNSTLTKAPFKLLLSEFDPYGKFIKVTLLLPVETEFFIEVQSSKDNSNSTRLGYFEDIVFKTCNSYSCCDPGDLSRKTIARRCPDATTSAPTVLPFNKNFYSIRFLWYAPENFNDGVVFYASFISSPSSHWESVKSSIIPINTLKSKVASLTTDNEPSIINSTSRPTSTATPTNDNLTANLTQSVENPSVTIPISNTPASNVIQPVENPNATVAISKNPGSNVSQPVENPNATVAISNSPVSNVSEPVENPNVTIPIPSTPGSNLSKPVEDPLTNLNETVTKSPDPNKSHGTNETTGSSNFKWPPVDHDSTVITIKKKKVANPNKNATDKNSKSSMTNPGRRGGKKHPGKKHSGKNKSGRNNSTKNSRGHKHKNSKHSPQFNLTIKAKQNA